MAKKQPVSKPQAVLDYLKAHTAARTKEIVAALDKQGIKITSAYVATIKVLINKAADAEKTVVVEAAAPLEKPADTLAPDQLKKVAQALKRIRSRKVAPMT